MFRLSGGPEEHVCPICGAPLGPDDSACSKCGASIPKRIEDSLKGDKIIEAFMLLPGIGRNKAESLYDAGFRSIDDIRKSEKDRLSSAKGVGDALAGSIQKHIDSGHMEKHGLFLCPECGAFMSEDSLECPQCGLTFEEEEEETGEENREDVHVEDSKPEKDDKESDGLFLCPECGAFVSSSSSTCYSCGTLLDEEEESEALEKESFEDEPADVAEEDGGIEAPFESDLDVYDDERIISSGESETLQSLGLADDLLDGSGGGRQEADVAEEDDILGNLLEEGSSYQSAGEAGDQEDLSDAEYLDEEALDREISEGLVDLEDVGALMEEEIEKALEEVVGVEEEADVLPLDATEDDILFMDVKEPEGVIWEDDIDEEGPVSPLGVCTSCGAFVREEADECEVCSSPITRDAFEKDGFIGSDYEVQGIDVFKNFLGVDDDYETPEEPLPSEGGTIYLCSKCGAFMGDEADVCRICGTSVEEMVDRPPDYEDVLPEVETGLGICKSCGAFVDNLASTCEVCGASLEDVLDLEEGEVKEPLGDNEDIAVETLKGFLGTNEDYLPVVEDSGELFLCPNCGAFMSGKTFWCPVCHEFAGEGITEEEAKEIITEEIEQGLDIGGQFAHVEPAEEIVVPMKPELPMVEEDFAAAEEVGDVLPENVVLEESLEELVEDDLLDGAVEVVLEEESLAAAPPVNDYTEDIDEELISLTPASDDSPDITMSYEDAAREIEMSLDDNSQDSPLPSQEYHADDKEEVQRYHADDKEEVMEVYSCPLCDSEIGAEDYSCPKCGAVFVDPSPAEEAQFEPDETVSLPPYPSVQEVVETPAPNTQPAVHARTAYAPAQREVTASPKPLPASVQAARPGKKKLKYLTNSKKDPWTKKAVRKNKVVSLPSPAPTASKRVTSKTIRDPKWENYRSIFLISSVLVSIVMLLQYALISGSWNEYSTTFYTGVFLAFGIYSMLGIVLIFTGLNYAENGFGKHFLMFLPGLSLSLFVSFLPFTDMEISSLALAALFLVALALCILGTLRMRDPVGQVFVWTAGAFLVFLSALSNVASVGTTSAGARIFSMFFGMLFISISFFFYIYEKWQRVLVSAEYRTGEDMMRRQEYRKAVDLYEGVQIRSPVAAYDDAAWLNKGSALIKLGRYEEAVEALNTALRLNPENEVSWNNKGNALSHLGNHDGALKCYIEAVKLNKRYEVAWNNMGNTYARKGLYDKAIECYNRAIALEPSYRDAFINKGYVLVRQGRYEEAVACANKVTAGIV